MMTFLLNEIFFVAIYMEIKEKLRILLLLKFLFLAIIDVLKIENRHIFKTHFQSVNNKKNNDKIRLFDTAIFL